LSTIKYLLLGRSILAISTCTVLGAKIALADFVSGNDLLETCASKDEPHQIACTGYIGGVTDAYLHSGQFCLPQRIDPREISSYSKEFILRTKAIHKEGAVQMILLALRARWPCVNSGPGFRFNFQIR
jgi:hypothetical protein